jgi:hypothetical protein
LTHRCAPNLQTRLTNEPNAARRLELIEQALRPPEPQLLDTCVLQNIDWIDRQLEVSGQVTWDDAATAQLEQRYGRELAADLIDLGILYKRFEHEGGYPWLVCNAAVEEAGLLSGGKGERLRELIGFLAGHQEDWSHHAYPNVAVGALLTRRRTRPSPLFLRALGVSTVDQIHEDDGSLSFLPDRGDRLVVAYALLANVPVVLTTDRKTLWCHRERLTGLGLDVMRPAELLDLYEPYWLALESEFARRQAMP